MSITQMTQETAVGTPLQRMRRGELYKIARAYDIPYKDACKKKRLLPILKEAMDDGVFSLDTLVQGAKFPHFLTGTPDPRVSVVDVTKVGAPASTEPCTTIHLGNAKKWCVMQGSTIIHEGLVTKEEADGLHVPTGS